MRPAASATLLAFALAVSSCGYALAGRGTLADPSVRRVGVPLFKDATGKPGLDQKITQKVIAELLRRGRFEVVQDATGVDALVDGQLLAYRAEPIGFSATGGAQARTEANRYAVVLTAKVRYAKLGATESIWESEAFSSRDEYDIGEAETFFDREDQAIERLSTNFAKNLVAAMLEAF